MFDCVPKCIGTLGIENGSSDQIQMTTTFFLEVLLSPLIYRDAGNSIQKLRANSNDNNVLLGCPIESRNISKRSKLNTKALSKFKWQ